MSSEEFKIYTKTGDKGETSLVGGKRVPKYHIRIETYGTVDELNSFIGLIRDQDIASQYKDILLKIQEELFILESELATDPETELNRSMPVIKEEDIQFLENQIDEMNKELPDLMNFVLPGGHTTVSYCHVARTICRRAERLAIRLGQSHDVGPFTIKYLNRLSDYLFVLARKLGKDLGVSEVLWKTR